MRNSARVSVTALLLAAAACGGSDAVAPTTEGVVGDYHATTMTTTSGSTTTDQLAAGASLTISLHTDGTTTGQLHVPAQNGQPVFDASMAGTWVLSGSTVEFTQSADTFVRDIPFEARGKQLIGDRVFGSTRVRVTLTR